MNRFLKIGPFLLALPMLIFPVLHFLHPVFVADLVPPWIPWHLFWNYFTAVTIFAAGLAILFQKHPYLPALLLGIEISLFVLIIHGELLFHGAGDEYATRPLFGAMPSRVINAFKDFGLCGAVYVFAAVHSAVWKRTHTSHLLLLGRTILAISVSAFGLLHFVYPVYAPGIPPMASDVPFFLPGQVFWSYLSGAGLLLAGLVILVGQGGYAWVAWTGLLILAFELLVWVPRFFQNPGDLTGNWLKDSGIIGGILILAAALPRKTGPGASSRV